jgi:exonuclease SbcC
VRDLQEAQTRLEALRSQYADVQTRRESVEQLGPESPCPDVHASAGRELPHGARLAGGAAGHAARRRQYFRSRAKQLEGEPATVAQLGERARTLGAEAQQLERAS